MGFLFSSGLQRKNLHAHSLLLSMKTGVRYFFFKKKVNKQIYAQCSCQSLMLKLSCTNDKLPAARTLGSARQNITIEAQQTPQVFDDS